MRRPHSCSGGTSSTSSTSALVSPQEPLRSSPAMHHPPEAPSSRHALHWVTQLQGTAFLLTAVSQAAVCPMQSVYVLSGDEQSAILECMRTHSRAFAWIWTPQV